MTAHNEIHITFFANDKNLAKTVNLVKLPVLTRKSNRSIPHAADPSVHSGICALRTYCRSMVKSTGRPLSGAIQKLRTT